MVNLCFGSAIFPEEIKNYLKHVHSTTAIFLGFFNTKNVFCSARDKKEIHKQLNLNRLQWRIQDFRERGAAPEFERNLVILQGFCQKLHEN